MTVNDVIKVCAQIPNGRFFRIAWQTNCKNKESAAARNAGTVITKTVTAVARKGIHYTHIKAVQDEKIAKQAIDVNRKTGELKLHVEHRGWAEEVVPNLIIKHKTTGKHYMLVYSTTTRPKVQYHVNNKPISAKELQDTGYMQDSYWKNINDPTPVMTVPVEAIISIN